MFVIKAISIKRKNYYASGIASLGPLEGTIELLSEAGTKFESNLTEEQTRVIMTVISDSIVDAAHQMGSLLKQDVLEQITTSQPKALA